MSNDTEQFRMECEARYRLKQTGGKGPAVEAMLKVVVGWRGQEASDKLRKEMRRQIKLARGERE